MQGCPAVVAYMFTVMSRLLRETKRAEDREQGPNLRSCLPQRFPRLRVLTMRTDATTFPEPSSYQAWDHPLDGIHTGYSQRKYLVPAAWEGKKKFIQCRKQHRQEGVWVVSKEEVKMNPQRVASLIYRIKSRWGRRESGTEEIWALGVFGGRRLRVREEHLGEMFATTCRRVGRGSEGERES